MCTWESAVISDVLDEEETVFSGSDGFSELDAYADDEASEGDDNADGEDEEVTSAHKIVWLCQGLDFAVPPIPERQLEELQEYSSGLDGPEDEVDPDDDVEMIFSTDASLLSLRTKAAIVESIAADGWPKSGLALGFFAAKAVGCWFYLLVGEQQILLVSLGFDFVTDVSIELGKSVISVTHILLEEYLMNETNAARALSASPTAIRRLIVYSNEDGSPSEMTALWTEEDGLGKFVPSKNVFNSQADDEQTDEGIVRV